MHRIIQGALGTLAIAAWAAGAAASDRDFEWSGPLSPGDFVEVRGISGNIAAELAAGSTAVVQAEKIGRSGDFDEVRIVAIEERGGVVVCALYGKRSRSDSCNMDDDGHDWGGGNRNIDVSVDFTVRVPAGVEFIGRTVSGDVEAKGLEGDVDGATVSGDVVISTNGKARAKTVSGDLDIVMTSLDWDRMNFNTVSGDIRLTLPRGLDAEVDFESLSGDFRTSFDFDESNRRERMVGNQFEGRIGSGSRRLTFQTVSGNVMLREASR